MATERTIGFADPDELLPLQAESAINMDGFTLKQDFDPEIEDNLRKNTPMWEMIKVKKKANAPIVRRIRKVARPKAGFVDRSNLSGALSNNHADTEKDLGDPGQEVKAVAGRIRFDHFARSMSEQQGNPYGEEVAEETAELLVNTARFLEMALYSGDADTNPLEFNGLENLMPSSPDHVHALDLTDPESVTLTVKINEIVTRMTSNRNYLHKPTHIHCTGASVIQFQKEVGQAVFYQNQVEITPGVIVSGLMTNSGLLPLVPTPYLSDLSGNGGRDILRLYITDMDKLEWRGVYPFGGKSTFDPQIFDITQYIGGSPLVTERMVLLYGTPYAGDRGGAIHRLDVTVPSGTVWNVGGPETLI